MARSQAISVPLAMFPKRGEVSQTSVPLPAPKLRPRRHWRGGGVLVAEIDPPFGQVVRRHFDGYPVARQNSDPVFLHFTGRVGQRLVPVVEPHLEPRVRQKFHYGAFEFDQIFFRQWPLSEVVSEINKKRGAEAPLYGDRR